MYHFSWVSIECTGCRRQVIKHEWEIPQSEIPLNVTKKTVRRFINIGGSISVQIVYPHWSSGKPIKQTFAYMNNEKGRKKAAESIVRFIVKGYREI